MNEVVPISELGKLEIKVPIERCERCFFRRKCFLPGHLCYGVSCLPEELLRKKGRILDQKCRSCWSIKSNDDGYLCGQSAFMIRLISIFRVTRFGDTHFVWKHTGEQLQEEEDVDPFL